MTDRAMPPAPLSTAGNYARALRKIAGAEFDPGSMRENVLKEAALMLERQQIEVDRMRRLLNTPLTGAFVEAMQFEAAHQITRWAEEDVQKSPDDWMRRLSILAQKAASAFGRGDQHKGMHHIVSTAAAALNWHRIVTRDHEKAHAAARDLAASAAQDAKAKMLAPPDAMTDDDWLAIQSAATDTAADMAHEFCGTLADQPRLVQRVIVYARAAFTRGHMVGRASFCEVGHAVIKNGAIAASNDEPCSLDGQPSVPVFADRRAAA